MATTLAVIGLGALVNYRTDAGSLGEPPAGVDEERLIKTWVDLWGTFAQAGRGRPPKEGKEGQLPPASVHPLTPKEGARPPRRRDRG